MHFGVWNCTLCFTFQRAQQGIRQKQIHGTGATGGPCLVSGDSLKTLPNPGHAGYRAWALSSLSTASTELQLWFRLVLFQLIQHSTITIITIIIIIF